MASTMEVDDSIIDEILSTSSPPLTSAPQEQGPSFEEGDMFWGKVGTHPWWPCMIYRSPEDDGGGTFFKIVRDIPYYHVQYFGPIIERSWVHFNRMIAYRGKEAYDKYVADELALHVVQKRKMFVLKKFFVSKHRKNTWDASWKAADEAMHFTSLERVNRFGRLYLQKLVAPQITLVVRNDNKASLKRRRTTANIIKSDSTGIAIKAETSMSETPFDGTLIVNTKKKIVLEEEEEKEEEVVDKSFEFEKLRDNLYFKSNHIAVCYACFLSTSEEGNEMVCCAGWCGETFHKRCFNIVKNMSPSKSEHPEIICYKCNDCRDNLYRCFICRRTGTRCMDKYDYDNHDSNKESALHNSSLLLKCNEYKCKRRYHYDCLKDIGWSIVSKIENNILSCPMHQCNTCVNLNPGYVKFTKSYIRCVLCPATYHMGQWCLPAGSYELTPHEIICPRHLLDANGSIARIINDREGLTICQTKIFPSFGKTSKLTIISGVVQNKVRSENVSWCFICSKGGELLCCETCPASFHLSCLSLSDVPTEYYSCDNCRSGFFIRYGAVYWVKATNFHSSNNNINGDKWWPCEIIHFNRIPPEVLKSRLFIGQFCVRYFVTNDYVWVTQANCFPFEDGDDDSNHSTNSLDGDGQPKSLAKNEVYERALKVAGTCYNLRELRLEDIFVVGKIADNYKHIKVNYPIGKVKLYVPKSLSNIPKCDCNISCADDPCGIHSQCINRELKFECNPLLCFHGNFCKNQRFTLRQYPKQEPFKTNGRGWGLHCLEDISMGQFVNEYVGDLIDDEEAERRLEWAHQNDVRDYYMMILDNNRTIDAGPKGNLSRFMNHSCAPNLYSEKWIVNGETRVGFFALRDISSGEELTFNYNFVTKGQEKLTCRCGASNCSEFLGIPPATLTLSQTNSASNLTNITNVKRKVAPKKSSLVKPKKKHEDECYRCGDGGPLLLCDAPNCVKSYHLICLDMERVPSSKWLCPWHHCDICGAKSKYYCGECPSSFCGNHYLGNICLTENKKVLCLLHEELLEAMAISVSLVNTMEEEPATIN